MAAKELTIAPPEGGVLSLYSRDDLDVIRNHVAGPDFSDSELAYSLSVARARGLDPLQKQVYFSKRKKKDSNGNYVFAVTVEPTIDGFRVMAEKTGELDGYDGPYWCGKDGAWTDAWLTKDAPVACKITVFRKGKSHGFTATARYDAYVQGYDNKPNPIWSKMPEQMLAKCTESLALRKAFPSQLGPFYTREEMGQADNPDRFEQLPQEQPRQEPARVVAQKADTTPPLPDVVDSVPGWFCAGPFKPLHDVEGVAFCGMSIADLEHVVSIVGDNKARIRSDRARSWANAIEAAAVEALRDAQMAEMPPPVER